jgi:hypothetical protein
MKTQTSTPETRWAKRSLHQQLLHKFLNEYGYERGPGVAHAIITDILTLVEQAYATDLPPRHVYWPAVAVANGATGKTPEMRDLVHVRLHLVTDAEVALLSAGQGVDQPPARRTFNQRRFVRWCQEAYDQGGVLTLLDLSLLSGLAESYAGQLLRQYEQEHAITVPIRGTVHDIGPSVSHKAEVIRRYLRGQSPADIARVLNHSQHAVDRYLKDYEVTRTLAQKFPLHEIPALAKHAASLVREHVQLIREYEPHLVFYSPEPTAAAQAAA